MNKIARLNALPFEEKSTIIVVDAEKVHLTLRIVRTRAALVGFRQLRGPARAQQRAFWAVAILAS